MAHRYWKAKWEMGYVGTDSEEDIDLVEDFAFSEEEVEKMTDEEAEHEVAKFAYEQACEKIDAWAEKDEDR